MNYALIFAGGTGQRMNARAKPKQFLELYGKPIILYTLEHFEEHAEVDGILVVCLESYIRELRNYINKAGYVKIIKIIPGGQTGHESIYLGLQALKEICQDDDIVLIHDGVRPFINANLISANIECAKTHGTAITIEKVNESVVILDDERCIKSVPKRSKVHLAKAPQTFNYGFIWDMYQQAREDRFFAIDSAHMLSVYGKEMRTVESTSHNIKITAPADYFIFRALIEAIENTQLLLGVDL